MFKHSAQRSQNISTMIKSRQLQSQCHYRKMLHVVCFLNAKQLHVRCLRMYNSGVNLPRSYSHVCTHTVNRTYADTTEGFSCIHVHDSRSTNSVSGHLLNTRVFASQHLLTNRLTNYNYWVAKLHVHASYCHLLAESNVLNTQYCRWMLIMLRLKIHTRLHHFYSH